MEIKQIIANNIISLRKSHNMTQNELALQLNYSDNAVSRWERAEVTPSIETLSQIADLFAVPLASLLESNALEKSQEADKKQVIGRLAITLIFVSLVWFLVSIIFVYGQIIQHAIYWKLFVWAVPLTCLILLPFNEHWGKTVYRFVILSVFQWTLLVSIYLQFLEYNMWLIFIIGIPTQIALCIWSFLKPKNSKKETIN